MNNQDDVWIFPDDAIIRSADYSELYHAVYLQLKKDFHPHAALAEKTENLTPGWLFGEVRKMLIQVVTNQPQYLGPILYRVDLAEKQVRLSMEGKRPDSRVDELVMMILRREALKVWIRRSFNPRQ